MRTERGALSAQVTVCWASESPKEATRDKARQTWVQIPFQPIPSWIMAGKLFNLPEPPFPQLWIENMNTCLAVRIK